MKNHIRRKCFSFMTPEAKTIDLRSFPIEKRYRGMKRTPRCFFEFSLARGALSWVRFRSTHWILEFSLGINIAAH